MPQRTKLYVDGFNFYFGATADGLENGWCNLHTLANLLAADYLPGHSVAKSDIVYVTSPVRPRESMTFGLARLSDGGCGPSGLSMRSS